MKERIILGIDPGTVIAGYGIIEANQNKYKLLASGVFKLAKEDDHMIRMKQLFESTVELIDKHCPDELAIEAPFFGKNVQSMLKLGRAQGIAIAAALSRQIPIFEYSPKKIKQSITGNGNASKEQVAALLNTLIYSEKFPKYLDSTDAIAAALCHLYQRTNTVKNKSYSGWNAFINANPKRKI